MAPVSSAPSREVVGVPATGRGYADGALGHAIRNDGETVVVNGVEMLGLVDPVQVDTERDEGGFGSDSVVNITVPVSSLPKLPECDDPIEVPRHGYDLEFRTHEPRGSYYILTASFLV